MSTFPQGWFFIKNQNNGYVLSTEKYTAGEPLVIATVRGRDFDTQLWQHGEDGRLHNKKTGFVLDISKGDFFLYKKKPCFFLLELICFLYMIKVLLK